MSTGTLTNRIVAPGSFSNQAYDSQNMKVPVIKFFCKPLQRLEKTDRENLSAISKDSQVPNSQRSIKSKTQKKLLPHSKIVRLENELVRKVVEMKTKEEIILKVIIHIIITYTSNTLTICVTYPHRERDCTI